jgi:integrase
MASLRYELKGLCTRNREGSYSTQQHRLRILLQVASQLKELGFKQLQASSLKPKHVEGLVKHWQDENVSLSVIKNRLSHLRWWAEKIGKSGMLPADNAAYGLGSRQFVSETSKAQVLVDDNLQAIPDSFVRASLQLQAVFGLRREEAIKLQPSYADQGDKLILKGSWTKGGRPREIPIRTEAQRQLLQKLHQLVGKGSLIPPQRTYIEQLRVYERHTLRAGLHKLHGLRHAYAQQRYLELTGWPAPLAGGPTRKQLTPEQREIDEQARLQIAHELGHGRTQITTIYLGR